MVVRNHISAARGSMRTFAGSVSLQAESSGVSWSGLGVTTSTGTSEFAIARDLRVRSRALTVELRDGRTVSVPLAWSAVRS
jgi:hypothetical protein